MVPRTYPESFRAIAQKLQEEIDFPVRFSGQAIENLARNTYNYTTALTFDQQYFRLRAIFFHSVKSSL